MKTICPSDLTPQYIAGFLDGEGCFQVVNSSITIHATNTFLPILQAIKAKYGGSISPARYAKRPAHWRPAFRWRVCGKDAVGVINDILPFLIEKRPQAELLLKIRETSPSERGPLLEELKRLKRPSFALSVQ